MKKTVIRLAETHPITWRLRNDYQPVWIDEYKNKQGYIAAYKALKTMTQDEIVALVQRSGLRGRGGAGFPTGLKWSLMSKDSSSDTRYLLCNADEMEPGSYKDRLLMEMLPHLLIEGILIASFALKVHQTYIFLRGEYITAAENINRAIEEANTAGWLGKNILNSDFNLEIILHTGAGRYICGEETALINSLEGKRPNPRAKPPFPAESGLWGKPTCVNNVETLCNLPGIVEFGANWYKSISSGKSKDAGTKLMGFSGKVRYPGVWELPFGTTAREILEEYAGGMQNGLTLKAWQPGGAGTDLLTKDHLDTPMDFETVNKVGSRLGTALAIAIDNTVSIVSLVRNLEEFFSRESCGWCTPCRDGLPWSVKLLCALEKGDGRMEDITILEDLCHLLGLGKSFCAHAVGAVAPLRSAIKYFRSEFEAGVNRNLVNSITSVSQIEPDLLKTTWE